MAVIPSKFTERYVYLRECCTYLLLLILKRCFDYARYGMCNLISHYLILSPGRCSVQSSSLNPRHRFSGEKWCVAAQFQLISHYTCRDTPFSLIFHVSRAGLIPFHICSNQSTLIHLDRSDANHSYSQSSCRTSCCRNIPGSTAQIAEISSFN